MQNNEVSGAAGGDGRAGGRQTKRPSSALTIDRTQEAGTQTQTPRPHLKERENAQEPVPQSARGEECVAEIQEMFKHIKGGAKSLADNYLTHVQGRGKHSAGGRECVEEMPNSSLVTKDQSHTGQLRNGTQRDTAEKEREGEKRKEEYEDYEEEYEDYTSDNEVAADPGQGLATAVGSVREKGQDKILEICVRDEDGVYSSGLGAEGQDSPENRMERSISSSEGSRVCSPEGLCVCAYVDDGSERSSMMMRLEQNDICTLLRIHARARTHTYHKHFKHKACSQDTMTPHKLQAARLPLMSKVQVPAL